MKAHNLKIFLSIDVEKPMYINVRITWEENIAYFFLPAFGLYKSFLERTATKCKSL